MATVKNAVYQVDNGVDFDEIHFRTSENMITGAVQQLNSNGYRKLSGGLIIQWGSMTVSGDNAKSYNQRLPYPIAFPNACLSIIGSVDSHDVNTSARLTASYIISENSNTNYHVRISSIGLPLESSILNTDIRWIAIGY